MPVSDQHPEYQNNIKQWQLVKDCVLGSKAVKTRTNGKMKGDAYLPIPNASDVSQENQARYNSYLTRANFVNFTGHTRKGMLGMVFRKDMICELPSTIEYLKENANGGGLTLEQQIKDILGGVLDCGRYGLLVDYPDAESDMTKAQVEAQNLRANILKYNAENVINWRTEVIGAVKKLSMVVLTEEYEKLSEDGFSFDPATMYRVLWLIDGTYMQQVYDDDLELIAEFTPRKSDGSTWDEIPFIFVGSENNDETVDSAPLYDIAEVNLAHYRNSADYEESSFMVGQPTPVIAGLTQGWVDEVLKGSVQLGSRSAIPLPEGGSATLLQANANQMPEKGMEVKEKQMLMIGARLIQDKNGQETVDAVKLRYAGQTSDLASIVDNVEAAVIQCCMWSLEYMGGDGEIELKLNRQFYDSHLDAQQVMALIQLADRGDISSADIRDNLRKAGLIDPERTDDDIDNDIDLNGANLMLENEPEQRQDINPQLLEILNKLAESRQEYIPATDKNGQGDMFAQPTITVEAPIVNVTLPEGMIQLPENMVTVQVDAPQITVESPEITIEGQQQSPLNVTMESPEKDIKLVYNANGKAIGAESRVVK